MAIEYIGGITLKAPQHIEDKLAALEAKATQGKLLRGLEGEYTRELFAPPAGSEPVATFETDGDAALFEALSAAHTSLLAVVRAAREMRNPHGDSHDIARRAIALDDALRALDAVEV
ncbi:MAG TPA: hypothetical protein VE028_04080 [Nitratidesulfovibrio sp.]|nr:hypothetical protein [Nitratidesulfovibrio sp.]